MRSEANMKTPLFLAHGMEDMVVDFIFGKMSYLALKAMGIDVQFEEFEDLGHSADETELRMVRNWIKKTIDTGDEQEEKKAEEPKV
jgi:lysophospholipase I